MTASQQDIESWLWESANILRGPVDPASPVRNHLKIPKDYKLIVGLSLGYASDNPINTFNVGRDDLDLGF